MPDPMLASVSAASAAFTIPVILFRMVLSAGLAAVIGCERSSKRHSAGLRTFILVAIASTAAMLLDTFLIARTGCPLYLLSASAVIGAVLISVHSLLFSSRSQIKGLTTGAGLWTCGILGLTSGAGFYTVTLSAFFVMLGCLTLLPPAETFLKNRSNHFEIHLELKSSASLQNFVSTIRRLGLKIDDIESNPAYQGSGLSVYSIALTIVSRELKQYKTHAEIIEALRSLDYIHHIEEM